MTAVEAASERCDHQIALSRLQNHVANRDRGQASLEPHPVLPTINREEGAEFGSGK